MIFHPLFVIYLYEEKMDTQQYEIATKIYAKYYRVFHKKGSHFWFELWSNHEVYFNLLIIFLVVHSIQFKLKLDIFIFFNFTPFFDKNAFFAFFNQKVPKIGQKSFFENASHTRNTPCKHTKSWIQRLKHKKNDSHFIFKKMVSITVI